VIRKHRFRQCVVEPCGCARQGTSEIFHINIHLAQPGQVNRDEWPENLGQPQSGTVGAGRNGKFLSSLVAMAELIGAAQRELGGQQATLRQMTVRQCRAEPAGRLQPFPGRYRRRLGRADVLVTDLDRSSVFYYVRSGPHRQQADREARFLLVRLFGPR